MRARAHSSVMKRPYGNKLEKQRIARVIAWIVYCFMVFPFSASAQDIKVFAASSLRDVIGEFADVYEAETGDSVVLVFAASSAIARQVAQGAPADVVALADRQWAEWLVDQGTVKQMEPFATTRLVLVGRDVDPVEPEGILLALDDGMLAMAQVDAVPAGRYGKTALETLRLWDSVEGQVVQAANVRAALRFVERGEAALGIGYASDLVALPALSQVYEFPLESHAPVIYSMAAVTPNGDGFVAGLTAGSMTNILNKWGFSWLEAAQ